MPSATAAWPVPPTPNCVNWRSKRWCASMAWTRPAPSPCSRDARHRLTQQQRTALRAAFNIGPSARDLLVRGALSDSADLRNAVRDTLYLIWNGVSRSQGEAGTERAVLHLAPGAGLHARADAGTGRARLSWLNPLRRAPHPGLRARPHDHHLRQPLRPRRRGGEHGGAVPDAVGRAFAPGQDGAGQHVGEDGVPRGRARLRRRLLRG